VYVDNDDVVVNNLKRAGSTMRWRNPFFVQMLQLQSNTRSAVDVGAARAGSSASTSKRTSPQ
jgi:hypothetical protein